MKLRELAKSGKIHAADARAAELADDKEEDEVHKAAHRHFMMLMVVKVLIGNCLQLWMHSSFYAVTYDFTGKEAKVKIIISMIASAVQALIRCKIVTPKLG